MAELRALESLAAAQIDAARTVYQTAATYPHSRVAQALLRRYMKVVS